MPRIEIFSDVSQVTDMVRRVNTRMPATIRGIHDTLARVIEQEAKMRVPIRTGRLLSSIFTDVSGNILAIQARAPYASFVEHGTRYMRPQPFLRPALEVGLRSVGDVLHEHLRRLIPDLER